MPFEIDVVERRIRQLEIEKAALAKETDDASKARLAAIEAELAELVEQRAAMVAHWENEKQAITEIRAVKEQLEAARTEAERVEREGDLERAAQLRYGTMRELEQEIEQKTARLERAAGRPADAEGGGRRGGRRRDRVALDGHPRVAADGGRDRRSSCAWRRCCTGA